MELEKIYDLLVKKIKEGVPDGDGWRSLYGEEEAEQYAAELQLVEDELTAHCPEWQSENANERAFTHIPGGVGRQVSLSAFIWRKVRLKRRYQIRGGNGSHGIRLQEFDIADGQKTVRAVSVIPRAKRTPAFDPVCSIPVLAAELGATITEVQEALKHRPQEVRDARGWVAAYMRGAQ